MKTWHAGFALLVTASCVSSTDLPNDCAEQGSFAPTLTLSAVGGAGIALVTSTTTTTMTSNAYTDAAVVAVTGAADAGSDASEAGSDAGDAGDVSDSGDGNANPVGDAEAPDAALDAGAASTTVLGPAGMYTTSDASTTTTSVTSPVSVAVQLELQAHFPCAIQGDVHATLTTSVGQFSNGLAAAGGAGGAAGMEAGAAASGGSSGVSGASVSVLLGGSSVTDANVGDADAGDATVTGAEAAEDAGPSTVVTSSAGATSNDLVGYATVQVNAGRTTYLQGVIGDATVCAKLTVLAMPQGSDAAVTGATMYGVSVEACSP